MKQILLLLLFAVPLHAQTPAEMQVDSLIRISRTHTGNQDFTHAMEAAQAADQLALEQCGRESRAYGSACFNHGRVLYFQGVYDEAEPWYLESKNIRAKVLGTQDQDYGKTVNNLAILYDEMGQYEKAEHLYLEVLAIREKTPGKESATYADALSNLASLYMQMGNYETSERLNLEVMEIREKVLGKEDPAYASSLNNLANLYYVLHNYEKAEPLYLESIAIREKAGDRESEDYIKSLDNLGVMYQVAGDFEKAEPLLFQSKNLWEKTLGPEHPGFLLSLNHLANLYQELHDYAKAEFFYLQTQSAADKLDSREHPNFLLNKESLGVLYYETGRYEKAESLLLQSSATLEKVVGKEHPYYSSGLDFLASLYWASGDLHKARLYLMEVAQIQKKLLVNASRHLSERELEAYIRVFADGLSRDCSFASNEPGLVTTCYDDLLFYKGFLLNAVSQVRKLASTNTSAAEKYNLFKSYRRRLAAEYAKPLTERKGVEALKSKADGLEKELTRTVAGYGEAMRQFNWKDVQSALPPDAVAIEFVHYQYQAPQPTASTLYAALLLRPGTDEPLFIPLFEEKQLAALVQTSGARQSDYVDRLYASADRGAAAEETLYQLLWQPLEKALQARAPGGKPLKTIYFSPSGLLHCVNLAAVVLPDGQVLADRYNLIQQGSTRQLAIRNAGIDGVSQSHPVDTAASTSMLFGGILYDPDSTLLTPIPEKTAPANAGPDLRGGSWNYLKGTEKEVDRIGDMMTASGLKPLVLKGSAATEEAFKSTAQVEAGAVSEGVASSHPLTTAPRILHFATHGFFYPNPESNSQKPKIREEASVFKFSDLPMMRSGLVMAGGNFAWKSGKPYQPGMEDGILTAYEIAQTDLSNTELVVLSACETGLGDIRGDEGVYGLQRAFKIAGARYLVMSLWRVPDAATQELMTAFYQKWLVQKMAIPDAFRAAQKEMRDKYQHPFFWAGFVLVE
jgi:CHAT domain-containing protein